jgi:hypothetical protein
VPARHSVYRSLVRLYPKDFRRCYGDDLVAHFADLVRDRGTWAAWVRTSVDLLVTIPRYRLESIMTEQHSATAVNVAITLLAAGGVMSVLTGVLPGLVLFGAALVLAVAQRTTLARAMRTPDTNRRRRRLRTAALLAFIFLASIVSYALDLSDDHISGTSLVVHNAVGTPAMIGAIVFFIVGLLTPREPDDQAVNPVVA